jgi:hypothetical protein
MESLHQILPEPPTALPELFETCRLRTLRETGDAEHHAFEMYDARNAMVQEAAYLRAQARGFAPGHELEDWVSAEREIDARLFAAIAPVGFVG